MTWKLKSTWNDGRVTLSQTAFKQRSVAERNARYLRNIANVVSVETVAADRYFADLNPRYGAAFEKRWTVFYRNNRGALINLGETDRRKFQFVTRKGAENTAAYFNSSIGSANQ